MPAWKITYFFEKVTAGTNLSDAAEYGWTENFVVNTATQNVETMVDAATQSDWIAYRRAFLDTLSRIRWVKVSLLNALGNRYFKVAYINRAGLYAGGTQVQCAAYLMLLAAPDPTKLPGPDNRTHRRAYLLRGLPQDLINGDVLKTTSGAFGSLVNFAKYMGNSVGDLSIRGATAAALPYTRGLSIIMPTNLYVPITAATFPGGRTFNITAALGPAPVSGRIQISGMGSPREANAIWTVQAPAGGPPYVLGRARRNIVGTWSNDGVARSYAQIFQPITNFLIVGLRTKRTGRPFKQPVGRARRR